jgi:hypothetical protein
LSTGNYTVVINRRHVDNRMLSRAMSGGSRF